jgi:hypothetical protein
MFKSRTPEVCSYEVCCLEKQAVHTLQGNVELTVLSAERGNTMVIPNTGLNREGHVSNWTIQYVRN